ncbi:MAG: dCTP deaminase [Bacilli bacterium]|nr:dCTP deaminase [Bacilli bacterium]MDD4407110.1 dCTP deaminase [Bacilli bacterium]
MILSGDKIEKCIKNNQIKIIPFNKSQINPNSYNYRLGEYLKVYDEKLLDSKRKLKTKIIKIPDSGIILYPNKIYLGFTDEIIGSDYYVPIITGRSSTGRLGLFVHITSDLVDIGFQGRLTLQLHATQPVKVYKDMEIGQIMFWKIYGKIKLYQGKYQNSDGPRETEIWRDFKNEK